MAKKKTIKKILIANRGEIACRVMRTANRLGIKTVAVYSDADRKALHVRTADEAVHIGPSPAAESYLVIDKIIDACKQAGADAVHPGYGFLSENPDFVRACDKAGIIFIGPKAESMEAMGLKDAAKKLMEKAGVPVTPGYHGKDQNPKNLAQEADIIGYPVLIKAVAGGGGKGMRKVEKPEDFADALKSCQREAKASFGNDDVLIEKYIQSPRHIEVQVFGDSHGNVVHMFERDCSLQRRHQKVIEEAPAPGMTDAVRKAMTDAAINAAKAVDYVGAGTVEFIVDGSGALKTDGFWFMEMNTRLQVEHPVSEMVTGYDFVELQIRIAEGGKLPKQKDIQMDGHAIEARLYAEDPANDFLPSIGSLDVFVLPGLHRADTGVERGDQVVVHYDPMIGKLIVHANSRPESIETLLRACRQTQIYPVRTNLRFLANCLAHPDFVNAKISTHFIPRLSDVLMPKQTLNADKAALAIALAPQDHGSTFADQDGWRMNLPSRDHQIRYLDGEVLALPLYPDTNTDKAVFYHNVVDGHVVFVDGLYYLLTNASGTATDAVGGNALTAPMPGKIIAINVKAGDEVKAGDKLIVMEAMKMEMSLEAPRDGVVANIPHSVGDLVSDGETLLELEE